VTFVKIVDLCKTNYADRCVSVFYAIFETVGSKLYYWHSEESDESYHFELKRIDLKNMSEEDELMKSFKVDRLDKKYSLIGVMYYK